VFLVATDAAEHTIRRRDQAEWCALVPGAALAAALEYEPIPARRAQFADVVRFGLEARLRLSDRSLVTTPLTDEQWTQVRQRYEAGERVATIAADFDATAMSIRNRARSRQWCRYCQAESRRR